MHIALLERLPLPFTEQEQMLCVLHNLSFFSMFSCLMEIYGNDDLSTHTSEVADLLLGFAQYRKLPKARQQKLYVQGLTHDTGKLGIVWSVLRKPDRLTNAEFEIMKTHTLLGWEFLKDLSFADSLGMKDAAHMHHEYLNGTGYPEGKTADEISEDVRMLTIVDKYQALTAKRVYKEAKTQSEAILILLEEALQGNIDQGLTMDFVRWLESGRRHPDYGVLKVPQKYLSNAYFQENSFQYRQEIIALLNKIIANSPNGYDTEILSQLSNTVADILQLDHEESRLLTLSAILGGIGNLAKVTIPNELVTDAMKIENRRTVVENTTALLNKSRWLQSISNITRYMYAYYNGDEGKTVYCGEKKIGKALPYISRVLAVIATIFTRTSSDPFDYIVSEKGCRFDPDIVEYIVKHKNLLAPHCAFFRKKPQVTP